MQDSFSRSLQPVPPLASISQTAVAAPAADAVVETVPSVPAADIQSSNDCSTAVTDGGGSSSTQLGNVILARAAGVHSSHLFILYFPFFIEVYRHQAIMNAS
jgi:hypothetical protein